MERDSSQSNKCSQGLLEFIALCGKKLSTTTLPRGKSGRRLTVARSLTKEVESSGAGLLDAYPKFEGILPPEELLEGFAFPMGFKTQSGALAPPSRIKTHSATMTDEKGRKLYLSVTTVYLNDSNTSTRSNQSAVDNLEPIALILASTSPVFSFLEVLGQSLCQEFFMGLPSLPLERYVQWLYHGLPLPVAGKGIVSTFFCKHGAWLRRPSDNCKFPLLDVNPGMLVYSLGPDSLLALLCCFLAEVKIIFTSSSEATLVPCIETFTTLLFPLQWPHLYVPLLPHSMADVIAAPVPYILGVRKDLLLEQPEDTVVVDLDTGRLSVKAEVAPAPKTPLQELRGLIGQIMRSPQAILQRKPRASEALPRQRSSVLMRNPSLGALRARLRSSSVIERPQRKQQQLFQKRMDNTTRPSTIELTDAATATLRSGFSLCLWKICGLVASFAQPGAGNNDDVHARSSLSEEYHIPLSKFAELDKEMANFYHTFKDSQIFADYLDRFVSQDDCVRAAQRIAEYFSTQLEATVQAEHYQEPEDPKRAERLKKKIQRMLRSDAAVTNSQDKVNTLFEAMSPDIHSIGLASSASGGELQGTEPAYYTKEPSTTNAADQSLSDYNGDFLARRTFVESLLEDLDVEDRCQIPAHLLCAGANKETEVTDSEEDLHLFITNLDTGERIPLR